MFLVDLNGHISFWRMVSCLHVLYCALSILCGDVAEMGREQLGLVSPLEVNSTITVLFFSFLRYACQLWCD